MYGEYKDTPCLINTKKWMSTLFEMPNDWIITFKAISTNYWEWIRLGLSSSNTSSSDWYALSILSSSYNVSGAVVNVTYFPYNSDYASVKLVKQDNTLSVYVNDTLKGTGTVDTSNKYFVLHCNYMTYIADVKVKSI